MLANIENIDWDAGVLFTTTQTISFENCQVQHKKETQKWNTPIEIILTLGSYLLKITALLIKNQISG